MNQSTDQDREDQAEYIFVSVSGSVTVRAEGRPDDDGPAGVREPLGPRNDPPSLAAEVEPRNAR